MTSHGWKMQLDKYASKVGFAVSSLEAIAGAPDLPTGATIWKSDYAQLLAIPIESMASADLQKNAAIGQEWLDASCMKQENALGCVIDGYLLIILPKKIDASIFPIVRAIELDPTSCRKHIIWPEIDDKNFETWPHLLRVTALGLPESPSASGMTNSPKLENDFQIDLLTDVKNLKGRAAARKHIEVKAGSSRT